MVFKTVNFQSVKQRVLDYYADLDCVSAERIDTVLEKYTAESYVWRGMHPFNMVKGGKAVADIFWSPLKNSFFSLQRRPDIFFAGFNEIDNFSSLWVCQTGHFMGLFDKPWLGMAPTFKMVFIRYAEFHKLDANKIVETALFVDIPAIMRQAGYNPFGEDTGTFFIQPGPKTHDGLLLNDVDENLTRQTLDTMCLMKEMVEQGRVDKSDHDGLGEAWHDDMIWFGPAGIGATYTKERYQKQHRKPFVENMDFDVLNDGRADIGHICCMAEGHYGGFFGWPNFCSIPTGGFLGLSTTDKVAEFRIVDIYRVNKGKIAENWVYMDLLHFMKTQGVDVWQIVTDRIH